MNISFRCLVFLVASFLMPFSAALAELTATQRAQLPSLFENAADLEKLEQRLRCSQMSTNELKALSPMLDKADRMAYRDTSPEAKEVVRIYGVAIQAIRIRKTTRTAVKRKNETVAECFAWLDTFKEVRTALKHAIWDLEITQGNGAKNKGRLTTEHGDPDLDCDDFGSWQEAQDLFKSDQSDPHHLDDDKDGIACERLLQ